MMIGCGGNQAKRTTEILGFSGATPEQREILLTGQRAYEQYCAGCHGADGDGKGPAAEMLITKPRNFTQGLFKFKLTMTGSLPTDDDVYRTISNGVSRTSMPAWMLVPEHERRAIVQYLKTFSSRWQSEKSGQAILIPDPPTFVGTALSVAKGKRVYDDMQCKACHGEGGRGDGPSAAELTDSEGSRIKPFDFTTGLLKGGRSVKDIYRTFTTGLDGTPMPSYGEVIPEEDRWHMISYVLYLMNRTTTTHAELAQAEQELSLKKEARP
jgi:cytochrome c oxidase cbb3-type subunit 2